MNATTTQQATPATSTTKTQATRSLRRVAYWLTEIAKEQAHIEQLSAMYTKCVCGAGSRKPTNKARQDALWAGLCAIMTKEVISTQTAAQFGGLLFVNSPDALTVARELLEGDAA